MKTVSQAAIVTAALVLGTLGLTAAEAIRFRHLASVYVDDKGAGLKSPEGIACGANGQVIVGDTGNDRLLRFTYQDKTMSGGSEIKIPELSAPAVLQLNSKGDMYALDGKRRRIVRLGPDGAFKGSVSFDGVPPPDTVLPKSFRIDPADNLYVLDVLGARVLVLNGDGQFQRALALPDDAGFVTDLAIDFAGTVVAVDSIKRQIYVAAKDAASFTTLVSGRTESLATMPASVATSRGTIFVVEGPGGSIVSFGRDGSFLTKQLSAGWKEGSLNHPSQMCINDRDEVFIADRDNSRVQVFGLFR